MIPRTRSRVAALAVALLLLTSMTGSASTRTTFQSMFEDYDAIRTALVADDMSDAKERAATIRSLAAELRKSFDPARAGVPAERREDLMTALHDIVSGAEAIEKASDIVAVRESFGGLSLGLVKYRNMLTGERPVHAYCSMVKKTWLQPEGKLGNPYMGSSMATCGQVIDKATPAAR